MENVGVAFEVLKDDQSTQMGWIEYSNHLVWDIEMNFTRKLLWVKYGN